MDKNTRIWIIVFAAVIVLCCGVFAVLTLGRGGTVAVISVDGVEYERIDLSRVRESYDIEIETQWGKNTIHVEPGAISVTESDCPDHVCVRRGAISGNGVPIICMPHRLIIEIEGGGLYV